MGVLGVFVAFMACSSEDSSTTPPSNQKQTADESTQPTSSASAEKKANSSTSEKKSDDSKSDEKKEPSKAANDTIVVQEYVDDGDGTYEDPYFSSGIFCWTEGCESTVSSSSAEPKSNGSSKKSSDSNSGASIDQPSQEPPTVNGTSMTDNRDQQTYKLQQVGGKLWMAQDLNYKYGSNKCFDDSESNCTKYGRLYTYSTAKNACPAGWKLPGREEAQAVINDESYPWSYSGRCKTGECGFTGQMGFHWTAATAQDGDKNFDSNKGDSYAVIIVEKEPDYAGDETQKFFQVDDKEKYFSVRCVQE